MRVWLLLIWTFFGSIPFSATADQHKYYVQFVQGTNAERPPGPRARRIGPRLSEKLSPVFRWKYYWELDRQEITPQAHRVKTINLNASRSLEIEPVAENQIELRLYHDKTLVRKSRHQSDKKMMAIMGGKLGGDSAWFVVVRGEEPHS